MLVCLGQVIVLSKLDPKLLHNLYVSTDLSHNMLTLRSLQPMLTTQAVILLAFVLAAGFLLVILSCALWANWLPLLVGTSIRSQYS